MEPQRPPRARAVKEAFDFPQILSIRGEVFREKEGRRTLRFVHNGKSYFAKIYLGVGWKEILKNLAQLRLPVVSASRELKSIPRLNRLGIPTLHPVAYGRRGWNPARVQSFLVTDELCATESLEQFVRSGRALQCRPSSKWKIIRSVASIARTLHENGGNHRDFYLCHFFIDDDLKVYLIDLHRTQWRKDTPTRWRVKDVGGLYFSAMEAHLTRRDLYRFIMTYRNKPLRQALDEDRCFWKQVLRYTARLYSSSAASRVKSVSSNATDFLPPI